MMALFILNQMSHLRKMSNIKKTNLEWCRTCLKKEHLQQIFGNGSDAEISNNLLLVTGIEIRKNDGLPQKMCAQCKKIIEDVLKLRLTSKKTEIMLLRKGFTKKPESRIVKDVKEETHNLLIDHDYEDMNVSTDNDDVVTDTVGLKIDSVRKYERKNKSESKRSYKYLLDNCPIEKDSDIISVQRVMNSIRNEEYVSLVCCLCQKKLKTRDTLKVHMNWHLGINCLICEVCGKRCPNRVMLDQHMRGKHGKERSDHCAFCDYKAINKEQLKIHERRHTGEKPYVCDHCSSAFHRRANLIQHLAVHLPDKTVQCEMCPSRFKSIRFLRIHKNKAHRPRQYSYLCNICQNTFTKANNVRTHQVRIHGVPRDQIGPIMKIKLRRQNDISEVPANGTALVPVGVP